MGEERERDSSAFTVLRGIRAKRGESRATPGSRLTPPMSEAKLAEREGFEPPERFPVQRFSRPPP